MKTFEGRAENLRFAVLEAESIVAATRRFLESGDPVLHDDIVSRDDYIDNLKSIISNQCYAEILTGSHLRKEEINRIRAADTIGLNLERIADHCVNITRQYGYLEDPGFLSGFDLHPAFEPIARGLTLIRPVLESHDLSGALAVCKIEHELDNIYKDAFTTIMTQMYGGRNIENLLTTLFIFRYLERMGDAMLNIGEALIFAIIGEKIKIHQFEALRQTLDKSGFEGSVADIDFEAYWGTRSGCRIGRVDQPRALAPGAQGGIFKEGNLAKIAAERRSLEYWQEHLPGLAPRVISFHELGEKASLLIEFLPGHTLDELILGGDPELRRRALAALERTLRDIWGRTRRAERTPIDYIGQLARRVDRVRHVHPDLHPGEQFVGSTRVAPPEELILACERIEAELPAPAAVRIHGDFNCSNVVYHAGSDTTRFIDLYRSRESDFVQDVSVFLVSNFRMPVLEPRERRRIDEVIEEFHRFAKAQAREWDDRTFDARLALALARSFYTSTRFELNTEFAKDMFLRARFLLEKVKRHYDLGRVWEEFGLPDGVLRY